MLFLRLYLFHGSKERSTEYKERKHVLTPSSSKNLPEEKVEEDLKMAGDDPPTPEEEVVRLQHELRLAKAAERRLEQERDQANKELGAAEKGRKDAEERESRVALHSPSPIRALVSLFFSPYSVKG